MIRQGDGAACNAGFQRAAPRQLDSSSHRRQIDASRGRRLACTRSRVNRAARYRCALLSVVPTVAFRAGRWRPRRPATPACPASLPARPEDDPAQMFWPTFCRPRRATARLARPLTNGRRAQRRGESAASRSGSRLRRWGTSTRARSAPRTTRTRSSTPTRRITRFLVRLPAGPVPVSGRL